jgi:oligopeptidase B
MSRPVVPSSSTLGSTRSAAPPQAAQRAHVVPSPWGARDDDYYWLRDDTRTDPDVLAHLAAENAYTERVLAPLAGLEQQLFNELSARLQPDEASVPVFEHGYWYYSRFEPGLEYPIHARRRDSMQGAEEILLDGNELSRGLEYFALGDWTVSPDGRLLAFTQDRVGRRQFELAVKDLVSGKILADRVCNLEPEVVWAADNRSVLYIEKDPQTLLSVRLLAHVLDTDASADRLLYEEADHSYYLGLGKSRSERFLFLSCSSTQQSEWHYADANDPQLRFRVVLPREPDHEYDVEHRDGDFIIRTNWQAPNFRIVRAPIADSCAKAEWRDVLAHREEAFIEDFEVATGHLAVNERSGGLLKIRVLDWADGAVGATEAGAGTLLASSEPAYAMHLIPTPGIDSARLRYEYSSLTTPRTTYEFDVATGQSEWKKTQAVLGGFEAGRYATQYRLAAAGDGAQIPVSIAFRRDTPLDGSAPLYQYAYGSYGHSIDPDFRSSWVSLMDRGFVVAIAHVRGGQEMGRRWYDQGRLLHKMNSFTDFIDVTQMLVQERFGSPAKVCAQGGSAGGLLMGAVANLAPQRYRAIVAHVPFVDVVTTMLDESIPLTTNEFDQWGDPKQKLFYDYLLSYSPYDNVRAQDYPAMLVFTGLWDSQVQYFEPAKWVARLRARKTDQRPLLFSVDMNAGHGGKSGRYQRFREIAREYAFLLWQVGLASAVPNRLQAAVGS